MRKLNNIILFLFCLFVLISINTNAQEIKYRDVKHDFSTRSYRAIVGKQYYSPLIAGVLNYAFPSAGYFYVDEPLRGAVVFGSTIVITGVSLYALVNTLAFDYETGKSPAGSRELLFAGVISSSVLFIWSIFDVVRIAKIKNLAYQHSNMSLSLNPELTFMSSSDNNSAVYGINLTFSF